MLIAMTTHKNMAAVTSYCFHLYYHDYRQLPTYIWKHLSHLKCLRLHSLVTDYPTTKRVKSLVGDISNSEFVHKALKGVHSVIHVAGVVSWGTFPDYESMERVNVRGNHYTRHYLPCQIPAEHMSAAVDIYLSSPPSFSNSYY